MEKVSKELLIYKALTNYEHLMQQDELVNANNECFQIKDDTVCSKCSKKISNYPFYYLPKTKEIAHYYCFVGVGGD
jgi:hypothetical protein